MKILKKTKNAVKYFIGFVVVILLRLIPHPPNVEPITSTIMPFGKKWGLFAGAFFGATSIILFDLVHPTEGYARIGVWTWVTAGMFALMGIASGIYLKNKPNKIRHYVGFSIIATLVYDFITGPVMSTFVWKMTFTKAFIGQIPFTINHLIGNVVLATIVSPLIYNWVIENRNLETETFVNKIKSILRFPTYLFSR
jgi:hypothetical protein